MRSLEAHLCKPGSHGDLPFHHGCPVCRAERLAGALPPAQLVSARTRAGMAAALLAASAIPAAPAVASEPDSEQEGSADEKAGAPPSDADPGFDEGSQDIELPAEGLEVPLADDGGGVGEEPDPESVPDPEPTPDPPTVPDDDPIAPPGPAPSPPTSVPPDPPMPKGLEGPSDPPSDRSERRTPPETLPLQTPGLRPSPPRAKAPAGNDAPPRAPAARPSSALPAATGEARPASAGDPSPVSRRDAVSGDGRTHVVTRGECLWSIAEDQLGDDATPAQVARLVNRLWDLNRERIGTGEPNLLMVGTELQMP